MKTHKREILLGLLIIAVICVISACSGGSNEQPNGTNELRQLVQSYDENADNIQQVAADHDEAARELVSHKAELRQQFEQAESSQERDRIRSLYYELRAKENLTSRLANKALSDGIAEMIADVKRMKQVIDESAPSPEALNERRKRLSGVVNSIGTVSERLRKNLAGQEAQENLERIENLRVIQYQQLEAESRNTPASDTRSADLDNTIQKLEIADFQLQMLAEVLEYEREMLLQFGPAVVLDGIRSDVCDGRILTLKELYRELHEQSSDSYSHRSESPPLQTKPQPTERNNH